MFHLQIKWQLTIRQLQLMRIVSTQVKLISMHSQTSVTKEKAFLVYVESFQSSITQNGFVFVDFVNPNGKRTTGWIKLSDVSQ